MDSCQHKIVAELNATLEKSLTQLLLKLNNEQKIKAESSQRAWGKYRDTTCGLANDFKYATCLAEMTDKRVKELNGLTKYTR